MAFVIGGPHFFCSEASPQLSHHGTPMLSTICLRSETREICLIKHFFTGRWRIHRNGAQWYLMAKPNYQFEKRRREMDKKAKKAEKLKRKQETGSTEDGENNTTEGGESTTTTEAPAAE
jgi:hypothetical protein